MRGSSHPPGQSYDFKASSVGKSTGSCRSSIVTPSSLCAKPMREVRLPIPVAELSSARKSTQIFPSLTVAAGLKVSLSIHPTESLRIGQKNLTRGSGWITGLTSAGRTNPPKAHSGNLFPPVAPSVPERPAPPQPETMIPAIRSKMTLNDFLIMVNLGFAKIDNRRDNIVLYSSENVFYAFEKGPLCSEKSSVSIFPGGKILFSRSGLLS